jgi:hypothetical protein
MPSSGMIRRVAFVRNDVPPKRQFLQEPHGVSQKKAFFIVTAVKTSDFTHCLLLIKIILMAVSVLLQMTHRHGIWFW